MAVDTSLPLRDIHLPPQPSWWPPAIGWWLFAGLLLILIILALTLYRRYQGRRLQREARRALFDIQQRYELDHDEQMLVRALSVWLRRVCISHYPAVDVAGLTGMEWLRFLDKQLSATPSPQAFSAGPGQVILSAPYQDDRPVDGADLLVLCHTWISRLPRQARWRR